MASRSTCCLVLLALLAGCGSDPPKAKMLADRDAGARRDAGGACSDATTTYTDFAEPFFAAKCLACHSSSKAGDDRHSAPVDVNFDTVEEITALSSRIRQRVIVERAMPPGAPLPECDVRHLAAYLDVAVAACAPSCGSKTCGGDGCGGSCGTCKTGESCDVKTGACVAGPCTPSCEGVACGDDGCGGSCGKCAAGLDCDGNGHCVCTPACTGKSCGDDGCGATCGDCNSGEACSIAGQCICVPDCANKLCGDDGCGGSCGTCPIGLTCSTAQDKCECIGACGTHKCGDDGCGTSCGTCKGVLVCNTRAGTCGASCTPDCTGRECGDDGCGGTCAPGCIGGEVCDPATGTCACSPACLGKACGDDGCGSTCGTCPTGFDCNSGQCSCNPDCTGRECGDDGCGGKCGTDCSGSQVCVGGKCTDQCIASCSGKTCGDDGCGGSCGSCTSPQSCASSQCAWPSKSFGSDVYPIIKNHGCAGTSCHGGARPAQGLDMSSQSVAYGSLVNVASSECKSRKLVLPGAPASSYMLDKVKGTNLCSGSKMPKTGTGLSSAEINTVASWIGSGAAQ